MARKPKAIEVPGDSAPVSEAAKVATKLMAPEETAPAEEREPGYGEIVERLGTMVLRRGIGWESVEG